MICCKIIANYNDEHADFSKLCRLLAQKGDWLWDSGSLYFADTTGQTKEQTVTKIFKKAGYNKIFINEYDCEHEPYESDNIKGWITDKLVRITYNTIERDNQKILQETAKGLKEIDEQLNDIIREAAASQNDSNKTEDNKNGR